MTLMKKSYQIVVVCVTLVLIAFAFHLKKQGPADETDTADTSVINTGNLDSEKKQALSVFYGNFSSVLAADTRNVVSSTNKFKTVHNEAGVLCYGDSLKGHLLVQRSINKYLNAAITGKKQADETLEGSSEQFAMRDQDITAEQKSRLIAALQDISDAFAEK